MAHLPNLAGAPQVLARRAAPLPLHTAGPHTGARRCRARCCCARCRPRTPRSPSSEITPRRDALQWTVGMLRYDLASNGGAGLLDMWAHEVRARCCCARCCCARCCCCTSSYNFVCPNNNKLRYNNSIDANRDRGSCGTGSSPRATTRASTASSQPPCAPTSITRASPRARRPQYIPRCSSPRQNAPVRRLIGP